MKRPLWPWSPAAALLSVVLFGPGIVAADDGSPSVEIAAAPAPIPAAAPAPSVPIAVVNPASQLDPTRAQVVETPAAVQTPPPTRARCVRVVDGDTLVLEGDDRVRVLYVNTPEKKEQYGPEAGQFTRDMVLFKDIDLVYSADAPRDHYGRLLAEVYVDGQSLEEALLREGLAHLFLVAPEAPPETFERMLAAQAEARDARRNIWATERYQSTLHVTSFHANARGNDGENLNGEYLRIANISGAPLNVKGYTLSTDHGKVMTLPDFTVPAGYSFQVISGVGQTNDDPAAGPLQIYWGSTWPIWINQADVGTLRDADGQVVDRVIHAPKSH